MELTGFGGFPDLLYLSLHHIYFEQDQNTLSQSNHLISLININTPISLRHITCVKHLEKKGT